MATEVIKIIDPDNGSGTDYTSLAAWEAAQQGDLTGARNEIAVAKCRCTGGTADGVVTLAGWTTSATQYVKIWTDTSESYRHNGTYQTGNKYRIENSGSTWALVVSVANVLIIGIQVKRSAAVTAANQGGIWIKQCGASASVRVDSCVLAGYAGTTDHQGNSGVEVLDQTNEQSGNIIIVNNVIYDWRQSATSAPSGIAVYDTSTLSNVYAYNNTIQNCYNGIAAWSGNIYAKNNITQDCTDGFYGTFSYCGYNVTDLAEGLDTATYNNRNSTTVTFADEANDNFHLSGSDTGALGYGTNLYNDATYPFQTDIDAEDRGGSGATWDIGADEYVVSNLSIHASECVGSEGMFG